jgi:hypothetical protein
MTGTTSARLDQLYVFALTPRKAALAMPEKRQSTGALQNVAARRVAAFVHIATPGGQPPISFATDR